MKEETNGHPDLLELDALRAGEGTPAARAHVEGCSRCRGILDDMSRQAADLRECHGSAPAPPSGVEEKILEKITAGKTSPLKHVFPAIGAVAAALIIIFSSRNGTPPPVETVPSPIEDTEDLFGDTSADVNGDGVIDDRDVQELARLIAEGDEGLAAWDLNGDGATDRKDIDLLTLEIADRTREAAESEDAYGC